MFSFLLIALLHRRQLVVHLRLDARALSLQLSDSPNGVIDFLFVIDRPTQGRRSNTFARLAQLLRFEMKAYPSFSRMRICPSSRRP